MRYFIVSDVHSNLPALETVFEDMKSLSKPFKKGRDVAVNLGDSVGYGVFPNECMNRLWNWADINVAGNHDEAVDTFISRSAKIIHMSENAQYAARWTAAKLSRINKKRLNELVNVNPLIVSPEHIHFTHSNVRSPDVWDYVRGITDATLSFFLHPELSNQKVAFVGHLHVPQIYFRPGTSNDTIHGGFIYGNRYADLSVSANYQYGDVEMMHDDDGLFQRTWDIEKYNATLMVVPSVGQPRDNLNYTGYTIYDSAAKTITIRRIPYPIIEMQEAMYSINGYPASLADRLEYGK